MKSTDTFIIILAIFTAIASVVVGVMSKNYVAITTFTSSLIVAYFAYKRKGE